MLPKPLVPIRGRPLISYTLDALLQVGITTLHAVVGCERERLLEGLTPTDSVGNPPGSDRQSGVAKAKRDFTVCAAAHLTAPFLLLMGDHLFEARLLEDFV